jgi:hypothetical protein
MSPADEQRLQTAYRREYRSLLQYARGASPYAGSDRKMLDAVMRIAAEELEGIEQFAGFLDRSRVPLPYPGSFPIAFTDLNYVTIRSLLPKLLAEQKQDLTKLEADRDVVADREARVQFQSLVDLHHRHLVELESLAV